MVWNCKATGGGGLEWDLGNMILGFDLIFVIKQSFIVFGLFLQQDRILQDMT